MDRLVGEEEGGRAVHSGDGAARLLRFPQALTVRGRGSGARPAAAFDDHDLPDLESNLVVQALMGMVTGIAHGYMLRKSDDEDAWGIGGRDVMRHGLKAMLDGPAPRMEATR